MEPRLYVSYKSQFCSHKHFVVQTWKLMGLASTAAARGPTVFSAISMAVSLPTGRSTHDCIIPDSLVSCWNWQRRLSYKSTNCGLYHLHTSSSALAYVHHWSSMRHRQTCLSVSQTNNTN